MYEQDNDCRRQDKRRNDYDDNLVWADGLYIKSQVGEATGTAYRGYAVSDVLFESGVMVSGGRAPAQSSNCSDDEVILPQ